MCITIGSNRLIFGFVLLAFASSVGSVLAAPSQIGLKFTSPPPKDAEIASNIDIQWKATSPDVRYRFKLDVPGDWQFGLRYAMNKWSEWGTHQSVSYNDFVLEGKYMITVEARTSQGKIEQISAPFHMHFVMPQIRVAGLQIDWRKAVKASTPYEKYSILSNEFLLAHKTWMKIYEAERRALKMSWSGDRLVRELSETVLYKSSEELVKAAEKGSEAFVGKGLQKILLPKTVYDIAKSAGRDFVLIYRNKKTNEAAFNAVAAYWAHRGYLKLAEESR